MPPCFVSAAEWEGKVQNGEERERWKKRRKEEEEWEEWRGANAQSREMAGRLSVNGSLEKRNSWTIHILSMQQNYIIAQTHNHNAHTQQWRVVFFGIVMGRRGKGNR